MAQKLIESKTMDSDRFVPVYKKLYTEDCCLDNEVYGDVSRRDDYFVDFVKNYVAKGSTILDASCGRGHLMKSLISCAYNNVVGTEIAECLLDKDLKGLDVTILPYSKIDSLGENKFDVVISNDVLEHLPDEESVNDALRRLSFISKKWLLISVGIRNARAYCKKYKLSIPNLHSVRRRRSWWDDTISRRGIISNRSTKANSYYVACRVGG